MYLEAVLPYSKPQCRETLMPARVLWRANNGDLSGPGVRAALTDLRMEAEPIQNGDSITGDE